MNCPKAVYIDVGREILNFPVGYICFRNVVLYSRQFIYHDISSPCLHDSDLLEAIKCTPLSSAVISSFFGTMSVSDFLLSIWISIAFLWFDFHTSFEKITESQLFCIVYLSSTSPSSQTGGCFCFLAIAVTEMLSAVSINTSTISNLILISQLNHFTFVSALLLPVLRLNLTLPFWLQGLGTGSWLNLTRQDFPAIYNQLTKANRVSSAR